MSKLSTGFLVAPLFPAAAAALLAIVTQRNIETGFLVAGICIVGGYLSALFVGMPLFVIWRRFGWFSFKAICILGGTSAFLLTFGVSALIGPGRNSVPWLIGFTNLLTFTLPVGIIAGGVLWWLGIRGNIALTSGSTRRAEKPARALT